MQTFLLKAGRQIIGRAGNMNETAVAVNIAKWLEDYPAGIPQLMVTTPGGQRIPLTVTVEDGLMVAVLPDTVTVGPGLYVYTAVMTNGGTQVLTERYECIILGSELAQTWKPLGPRVPDWAERIFVAADVIERAMDGAIEARTTAVDAAASATASAEAAADSEGAAALSAQAAAASASDAQDILDNVVDQGAAQVSAIQEAGAAARESIPETYTQLSDDVSDLKSQVSVIEVIEDNLKGKIQWSETAVSLLMQILEKAVYSQDTSSKRELLSEELEYVPVTGWTIVNIITGITTSNTNTVIQDGASYTATLTATDQTKYVGKITVTMNSIDISDAVVNDNVITIPAVTGDLVIRCSAVVRYNLIPSISNAPNITTFVYSKNTYAYSIVYENESNILGGILHCTIEPDKMTGFNVSIWLLDSDGDPYKYTSYVAPQNNDVSGAWEPVYSNPGEGASYPTCTGSFDVEIPEGCKVFAWIRTSFGTVIDTEHLTDESAKRNWALNGGVTFVLEG